MNQRDLHDWKGDSPPDFDHLPAPRSRAANRPPRLTKEQLAEIAAQTGGYPPRGFFAGVRCAEWPWRMASLMIDMALAECAAAFFGWLLFRAPLIGDPRLMNWVTVLGVYVYAVLFVMSFQSEDPVPDELDPSTGEITKYTYAGQSPGKMLLGLQVVHPVRDSNDVVHFERLSHSRSICRTFLHCLDFLVLYIGWLLPIGHYLRQTFADHLTHTLVVRPDSRLFVRPDRRKLLELLPPGYGNGIDAV